MMYWSSNRAEVEGRRLRDFTSDESESVGSCTALPLFLSCDGFWSGASPPAPPDADFTVVGDDGSDVGDVDAAIDSLSDDGSDAAVFWGC